MYVAIVYLISTTTFSVVVSNQISNYSKIDTSLPYAITEDIFSSHDFHNVVNYQQKLLAEVALNYGKEVLNKPAKRSLRFKRTNEEQGLRKTNEELIRRISVNEHFKNIRRYKRTTNEEQLKRGTNEERRQRKINEEQVERGTIEEQGIKANEEQVEGGTIEEHVRRISLNEHLSANTHSIPFTPSFEYTQDGFNDPHSFLPITYQNHHPLRGLKNVDFENNAYNQDNTQFSKPFFGEIKKNSDENYERFVILKSPEVTIERINDDNSNENQKSHTNELSKFYEENYDVINEVILNANIKPSIENANFYAPILDDKNKLSKYNRESQHIKNIDNIPEHIDNIYVNIDIIPKDIDSAYDNIDNIPKNIDNIYDKTENVPDNVGRAYKNIDNISEYVDNIYVNIDNIPKNIESVPKDIDNIPKDIDNIPKDIDNIYDITDTVSQVSKSNEGVHKLANHINKYYKVPNDGVIPIHNKNTDNPIRNNYNIPSDILRAPLSIEYHTPGNKGNQKSSVIHLQPIMQGEYHYDNEYPQEEIVIPFNTESIRPLDEPKVGSREDLKEQGENSRVIGNSAHRTTYLSEHESSVLKKDIVPDVKVITLSRLLEKYLSKYDDLKMIVRGVSAPEYPVLNEPKAMRPNIYNSEDDRHETISDFEEQNTPYKFVPTDSPVTQNGHQNLDLQTPDTYDNVHETSLKHSTIENIRTYTQDEVLPGISIGISNDRSAYNLEESKDHQKPHYGIIELTDKDPLTIQLMQKTDAYSQPTEEIKLNKVNNFLINPNTKITGNQRGLTQMENPRDYVNQTLDNLDIKALLGYMYNITPSFIRRNKEFHSYEKTENVPDNVGRAYKNIDNISEYADNIYVNIDNIPIDIDSVPKDIDNIPKDIDNIYDITDIVTQVSKSNEGVHKPVNPISKSTAQNTLREPTKKHSFKPQITDPSYHTFNNYNLRNLDNQKLGFRPISEYFITQGNSRGKNEGIASDIEEKNHHKEKDLPQTSQNVPEYSRKISHIHSKTLKENERVNITPYTTNSRSEIQQGKIERKILKHNSQHLPEPPRKTADIHSSALKENERVNPLSYPTNSKNSRPQIQQGKIERKITNKHSSVDKENGRSEIQQGKMDRRSVYLAKDLRTGETSVLILHSDPVEIPVYFPQAISP